MTFGKVDSRNRTGKLDRRMIRDWAARLKAGSPSGPVIGLCQDPVFANIVGRYPDRSLASTYTRQLPVRVDRQKALFSTWYELFPRSCGKPGRHGTFADCQRLLPQIAGMGSDVLYLPPFHPIGTTNGKGPNNFLTCHRTDPGSPCAIDGPAGSNSSPWTTIR